MTINNMALPLTKANSLPAYAIAFALALQLLLAGLSVSAVNLRARCRLSTRPGRGGGDYDSEPYSDADSDSDYESYMTLETDYDTDQENDRKNEWRIKQGLPSVGNDLRRPRERVRDRRTSTIGSTSTPSSRPRSPGLRIEGEDDDNITSKSSLTLSSRPGALTPPPAMQSELAVTTTDGVSTEGHTSDEALISHPEARASQFHPQQ